MTLKWSTPANHQERAGSIIQYNVHCISRQHLGFILTRSLNRAQARLIIQGLRPYTMYNCCVAAVTTKGESPTACVQASTLEEGIWIVFNSL